MANKVRDYKFYADRRELGRQRAAQDLHRKTLEARFDATAGEVRMKYERPQFAVVTASDSFREGWDRIFGERNRPLVDPPADPGKPLEEDEDERT